jgi:hypothetical protein
VFYVVPSVEEPNLPPGVGVGSAGGAP